MIHWERLPPTLQKSLQQWYLISSVAICITLSLCAVCTAHAHWTRYIASYSPSDTTLSSQNHAPASDAEETSPGIVANFYKDIVHLFRAIPYFMQLTSCTFDRQSYRCEGYVHMPHEVTQYIKRLAVHEFTRISSLSTSYDTRNRCHQFVFCVERQ